MFIKHKEIRVYTKSQNLETKSMYFCEIMISTENVRVLSLDIDIRDNFVNLKL